MSAVHARSMLNSRLSVASNGVANIEPVVRTDQFAELLSNGDEVGDGDGDCFVPGF